ncbi:zinc finger containing protein [Pseudozyma hubeiensis SY62]|uniref:Zinc finger containing protein n=1 Tax=Pseudozyma hubeiensis (strain SY62) TaxID=1305764 RepID=R9NZL0_PSEHS|nr:zinc finger containing protein [Pseudozyma hubeiensis SY62]GAC94224.1 zinc finger containing protein [Pseudozyma hubeiensis SY62]
MGHAQSRSQHDGDPGHARQDATIPSDVASHRTGATNDNPASHHNNTDAGVSSSSRKRRRDSTSVGDPANSGADHGPLSQRRRTSLSSDSQPQSSAGSILAGTQPLPPSMDLDVAQPPLPSPPIAAGSTATADLQQRLDAVQSRGDTPSAVEGGATPPPHLDALREERERARRQILEALGSAPASVPSVPTSALPSSQGVDEATAPSSSARQAPSSITTDAAASSTGLASASIAALIGGLATAPSEAPAASTSSTNNAASAASTASSQAQSQQQQPQQQQQQSQQSARPQAFRVPLQPEMISGTSMVVQGALVARTLAGRPASSDSSSPTESSSESVPNATLNQPSATSQSDAAMGASAGARSFPDTPAAALEGDSLRGAVTLEEQAVMLSRILGIAAAATAASLLNTSEAQHVDPSLLQTSLRRPFERMNQAPSGPNERWLADWQRAGTTRRSSSNDPSSDSTSAQPHSPSSHSLGYGLRSRLASFSRRVHSATAARESAEARLGSATVNGTGDTNASNGPEATSTATSENGTTPNQTDRRQEIIAHLLSAAEREAASQRLTRLRSADPSTASVATQPSDGVRSSSFSASRPLADSAQQDGPRSSLSRLVRSTIGTFLHPSRLLSSRSVSSADTQSPSLDRDGWTRGRGGRLGSSASGVPYSDFSLGPNDVSGTLRQVRNGILPDGVPGSFGSFLNHLVNDLMAAVQLMRPSSEETLPSAPEAPSAQTTNYFENASHRDTTSGAEVLDGESTPSQAQSRSAHVSTSSHNDPPNDSQTNPGEEDVETQARRQRDFQQGNLSFFRLFRFDPVAPSQLVPCIVVGVRSLNVTERFGEEMMRSEATGPGRDAGGSRQQTSRPTSLGSAGPTSPRPRQRSQSEGPAPTRASAESGSAEAEGEGQDLPASRFMLFVSGGRYPPNHPLLTSNPTTAGRDLMMLMDLLSTMQAMQHKPSTVTQREIDASELLKVKGSQVPIMVRDGKVTENMAERCLVCLEDWQDDDDCRVLACRHAFHTLCVDRWMTSSSNTCPMCRRQGVSKDGRQAGAETADSRRAAQT